MSEPRTVLLQTCGECGHAQYPQRELCGRCLSAKVAPGPVAATGSIISWTQLHASFDPWFRERGPWRIGLIALDRGPLLFAHLAAGLEIGQRVEIGAAPSAQSSSVWLAWTIGEPMPQNLRAAVQGTR